ncbi:hypothetical protein [Kitasatospora sp. NBC_00458]|uniref:hypothetical protein n=1 Tax=Kitasatospora sp. NBC_00458 TaxID=2903568 RepID=UPI002E179625
MYAQEPAPGTPPRPSAPPRPAAPPPAPPSAPPSTSPAPSLPSPSSGTRSLAAPPRGGDSYGGDSPWVAKRVEGAPDDPEALPAPYRAMSTGDWDYVSIDFGEGPAASDRPIPGQRTAEDGSAPDGTAEEGPDGAAGTGGGAAESGAAAAPGKGKAGKGKAGKGRAGQGEGASGKGAPGRSKGRKAAAAPDAAAPGPAAKAGAGAGRRPAPLLLLAAAVLVGGAVTGQLIAMLVGWALGYLSRHLTDFARKLAVFGIPLMTVSGSSLWFWGRAQGRWGSGLEQGQQPTDAVWSAAPDVLRLAAVLSAVFLLAMAVRRRRAAEPAQ